MEKFLHPMFLFDALLPFGAGMLFCLWQLWELKKENAKAAAAKAAQAATRASPLPAVSAASPMAVVPTAVSALPPSPAPLMSDVRKIAWEDLEIEEMTPLIGRRLIYTEKQMLAHVYLKQGAIVPAHDHINEQLTYIISGALRFWIGEHADNPGETYVDVRAGEVLVIPSSVRHRAEALEDTLDVDIFNPPRQDWIEKTDAYLRTGIPMTGSR
jgi:quercetin dioxygenase-like cupin family protein